MTRRFLLALFAGVATWCRPKPATSTRTPDFAGLGYHLDAATMRYRGGEIDRAWIDELKLLPKDA